MQQIEGRNLFGQLIADIFNPGNLPSKEKLARHVAHKTIMVTGASFGIGAETAVFLGSAGARILLVARTAEALEETATQIRQNGGEAHVFATDLTDMQAVDELATTVLKKYRTVDILVNNAGKSIRRSIDLSIDRFQDFERTMNINYNGPVRLLMALLKEMRKQKSGHLINISTVGVRIPPAPRWGAYQASKGAYDILLRSIDHEMRHEGIYTTSIYMPLVYTRMSAPTPALQNLPGLYPEEAAGLVGRAIIEKSPSIEPWWIYPAEVITTIFREPTNWLLSAMVPLTDDTESAKRFKSEQGDA